MAKGVWLAQYRIAPEASVGRAYVTVSRNQGASRSGARPISPETRPEAERKKTAPEEERGQIRLLAQTLPTGPAVARETLSRGDSGGSQSARPGLPQLEHSSTKPSSLG